MLRMLIVEADGVAAEAIRGALEQVGHSWACERVQSEFEFRQALARPPDLIVCDSHFPGFDGWQALAIAKATHPHIPFIFLGRRADPVAARAAEERGAAGLVAKSDLAALAALVRASLDGAARSARREREERRRSEPLGDPSSTATYLLERQAALDRALKDEDHSALSSILRRHPPVPVALLLLTSQSVRSRFAKWLGNANIEIELAASTTDALARLAARTHALLFTDRIELVQAARQLHAGSATHVVFVDANGDADARETLRMGANDCMPAQPGGEEFWARLTTARRIAGLAASLQLALTDNRILSTIDELTRCGSRRFFEHELPREVERAARLRRALSLVLCDVDHFKVVNDSHGREVGDEVLQEFAGRLAEGLRLGEDWVARIGGEEFAIVLPDVPGAEAFRIAERLRERIRGSPCTTAAGPLAVTASFGVAALEEAGTMNHPSPRALVRAADAALYQSKRAGRDRVTVTQIH